MILSDLNFILQWWFFLFLVGIVFLPLTTAIFSSFFDRGYIFAKILGTIIVSYIIFVLGTLHLLRFTQLSVIEILLILFLLNIALISKYPNILISFKNSWKIFLFEELLFFATLLFWSYIRSFQPDIHGLEKYMDFGFVNSILRSEYFPPKDMWFAPFSINYYYFGHLYTAVLTKLSGIPSSITYNLMLASLFAFTFTGAFSIGLNLMSLLKRRVVPAGDASGGLPRRAVRSVPKERLARAPWEEREAGPAELAGPRAILAGILTAFLVSLAGNLHTIYSFFKPYINENPLPFWQLAFSPETFPNSYWYPNATRFIYNTIHEFPIYSFVVSDLHGHVLGIPIVLTIIALLFRIVILRSPVQRDDEGSKRDSSPAKRGQNDILSFILLSFLLATAYMTNVWDGIIYFLLASLTLLFLKFKNSLKIENLKFQIYHWIVHLFILGLGFLIFTLPFSLNFKPFVSGIGILCAPEFLTKMGSFGPFLFEPDHCQRSPFWQLLILYGFFYFWVVMFGILNFGHWNLFRNWKLGIRNLQQSDIFALALILLSTLLILLPEFIYVKDIYPAHYRANTMFKLGYQAFLMLSLSSGYIIMRLISYWKLEIGNWKFPILIGIGSIGLFLVMIYPYFAINSYYGNLRVYYGLDGTTYLKSSYPTDYAAIIWLNKNIKGQPVILEAQGDSYTDFARVSANTGLPTVLGWTVHEWLWRGSYSVPAPRIQEVQTLYEAKDLEKTNELLKKYKIELVFVGDLERQKYPSLDEKKFQSLGKLIYQNGETKIYQIQ